MGFTILSFANNHFITRFVCVCKKIDEYSDLLNALEEYSRTRNPDAEAMCDLAMYNYVEVRNESFDVQGSL